MEHGVGNNSNVVMILQQLCLCVYEEQCVKEGEGIVRYEKKWGINIRN